MAYTCHHRCMLCCCSYRPLKGYRRFTYYSYYIYIYICHAAVLHTSPKSLQTSLRSTLPYQIRAKSRLLGSEGLASTRWKAFRTCFGLMSFRAESSVSIAAQLAAQLSKLRSGGCGESLSNPKPWVSGEMAKARTGINKLKVSIGSERSQNFIWRWQNKHHMQRNIKKPLIDPPTAKTSRSNVSIRVSTRSVRLVLGPVNKAPLNILNGIKGPDSRDPNNLLFNLFFLSVGAKTSGWWFVQHIPE